MILFREGRAGPGTIKRQIMLLIAPANKFLR
jgi:hypothetical protein